MTLRNGKHYLKQTSEDFSTSLVETELSPQIVSIVNLLTKITNVYDIKNDENKKKITQTEFINQKIRDYRELFYLTEYYFETLKPPTFIYFWTCCRKKAKTLILQLNSILNNENPNIILTGNDKTNANGLLKDLHKILELIPELDI